MGPYLTPPSTHSCLANCILHVVFLTGSAANKFLKDFHIFLNEEQLGRCMILIDRVAVEKNTSKQTKYEEKEMLRLSPEVDQIMSQPIHENILSDVSCSNHASNVREVCNERLFKIFRSGQRKK